MFKSKIYFLISLCVALQAVCLHFDHVSGDFVQVDDVKIYYEETGNPEGPVLLLLHGGMQSVENYNDILDCLSEDFNYRVIGIDTRGHGRSELGKDPLTYEILQKDVEAVVESLGLDELSIVGFSSGAVIACRLAAFTDLNIKKMVVIRVPWSTRHLEPAFSSIKNITLESWTESAPLDIERYNQLNPDPNARKLIHLIVQKVLDTSDASRPDGYVKNINCDVLAIIGEYDHFVTVESLADFCDLVEGAEMCVISGAGHRVIDECLELVTKEIEKFL